MTEIERLKADNDSLRDELESHAWKVSPAMAQAKIDELQSENFRLKGELGSVRSGSGKVCKFLRGEIRELKAKLAEIDHLDQEARIGSDEVLRQLRELKADNERLKEENKNLSINGATICYQCGTIIPKKES